jgi:hypothetical protein
MPTKDLSSIPASRKLVANAENGHIGMVDQR